MLGAARHGDSPDLPKSKVLARPDVVAVPEISEVRRKPFAEEQKNWEPRRTSNCESRRIISPERERDLAQCYDRVTRERFGRVTSFVKTAR